MIIVMDLLVQRIKSALDHAGLSWSGAAVKMGYSAQAATNWKNGKIGRDTLKKLASLTGVNSGWLLDGSGVMLEPEKSNAEVSEMQVITYSYDDPVPDGYVAIDYYDDVYVSAGNGYLNLQSPSTKKMLFPVDLVRECNVQPSSTKVIHVRGESMFPKLKDGQAISVDMSATTIYDGEIYAFQVGDDTKIKYLSNWNEQGKGGFKATSANPDKNQYPDEYYSPKRIEAEGIFIIGQYWWKQVVKRIRR
ncbi:MULTISPECIES: XRE family transcriptional regulator [Acinetobacter]|uniref:XRE family transcriptional regulator n=1 Tax=Acinetobacter TaxID=469 RepID=UPI001901A7BF|nr:helix-turn-helix transcriptional regulator [Acinetobacter courvalinii]MBJ9958375.1 helix-turn-helix transcriptional regulator [Acinetobacter courvalinii]